MSNIMQEFNMGFDANSTMLQPTALSQKPRKFEEISKMGILSLFGLVIMTKKELNELLESYHVWRSQ